MNTQTHGPKCKCRACSTLLELAKKVVQKNPRVLPSEMELTVRNFVYFVKNGSERVEPWADEMVGVKA